MLIELTDETDAIDPRQQEEVPVNNNATPLCTIPDQDTTKACGKNNLKRDVVKDILDDVIPPIK